MRIDVRSVTLTPGAAIWCQSCDVAQIRTEPSGRVALLHLDATQPVVLEGTAAIIWDLVDGHRTEQAILAELEAAFEDAAGELAPQVDAFLASLEAQRLIETAASAN